jgi:hypothetical protein
MMLIVSLLSFFVEFRFSCFNKLSITTMSRVYFDIAIDGAPSGRIEFKLYDDVVPKTADNFRYSIKYELLQFHFSIT